MSKLTAAVFLWIVGHQVHIQPIQLRLLLSLRQTPSFTLPRNLFLSSSPCVGIPFRKNAAPAIGVPWLPRQRNSY
jgi:hypothetical protein